MMQCCVFVAGGKPTTNNVAVGKNMCPVPTCTTTKGRVRSRLRHLPKKWTTLNKEAKEAISNELRKKKMSCFKEKLKI